MPVTSTGMTILRDGSREETQPDWLNRTALMVVPRHLYGSVALSQLRIEIVPIGIVRDDETDLPCARPVFHGRPLCPQGRRRSCRGWGGAYGTANRGLRRVVLPWKESWTPSRGRGCSFLTVMTFLPRPVGTRRQSAGAPLAGCTRGYRDRPANRGFSSEWRSRSTGSPGRR